MSNTGAQLSGSPTLQELPAPPRLGAPHSPPLPLPGFFYPRKLREELFYHRGDGTAATLNCSLHGSSPDTRSRLADFHANCRASYQTLTSCPADNYQACLGSYAGMIGKPPPVHLGSQWAPGCPSLSRQGPRSSSGPVGRQAELALLSGSFSQRYHGKPEAKPALYRAGEDSRDLISLEIRGKSNIYCMVLTFEVLR